MSAEQRWNLEKTALALLNELDPDHWNTPELISTDRDRLEIVTRWAGWNLTDCDRRGIRPQYRDLAADADQITKILASAEITLLDLDRENLIWNPVTHRLVVTDFDSVYLATAEHTEKQQQALRERGDRGRGEQLRQWLIEQANR
jgi:hypothetical protein